MCDNYQDQISLYIDGQLSDIETKELLTHIEVCDNCKKVLQELKSLVNELNNLEELDLPEGLHNKIMEDITILHNKKENKFSLNKITTVSFKKLSTIAAVFIFSIFSMSALLDLITSPIGLSSATEQFYENSTSYDTGEVESEESYVEEMEDNITVESSQRKMDTPFALASGNIRYVNKLTEITIESEEIEEIQDYLTSNYTIKNMETYSYGAYVDVTTNNDTYDELIEKLYNMGTVRSTSVTETDNTNEIIILNSRLAEKNSQSQRYMELMKKSENATELLYLTNAISDVEINKTNLKNNLDAMYIDYYNPVVSVYIEKTIKPEVLPNVTLGAKLQNTFITSLNDTSNFFVKISIGIASILPYVILFIILFLIIRLNINKRRKKNEK